MARIRTIKPEFWTDGKVVQLSPWARLFFIGMWNFTLCDHGHVTDDSVGLKLQILPSDQVDGESLLNELLDAGRVRRIELSDGRTFLHVPRFSDHQKLDKRWSPRCPVCQEAPRNSPELTQTRPSLGELTQTPRNSTQDRTGQDRKKDSAGKPAARVRRRYDYTPEFTGAWDAYGRKGDKAAAFAEWGHATTRADPATITAVIPGYLAATPDPRYRKDFERWLAGDCWESVPAGQSGGEVLPPHHHRDPKSGRRVER